jgi:methionyl-tRNA formyltransferase
LKKLNVLFFGTPDFSVPTLEMLYHHPRINLVNVITPQDKPVGRGLKLTAPPVAEFAKLHHLPLLQTENINNNSIAEIAHHQKIDVAIVLAFSHFLKQPILNLPAYGCFNIHTSLLPKYRGAAPIQYALLNGDRKTGVSIQRMVKKMDAGDICHTKELELDDDETGGQLYTRLKFQAALSTNQFISDLLANSLKFTSQDEGKVCFAPTLKKEDGFLVFEKKSSQEIKNQVRALIPWPGTYAFINKKRMKVLEVEISNNKLKPNEVHTKDNHLIIGCREGSVRLTKIQLEGKKPCFDFEFLNGLNNKEDKVLIVTGDQQ